jgi:hypothetical protein
MVGTVPSEYFLRFENVIFDGEQNKLHCTFSSCCHRTRNQVLRGNDACFIPLLIVVGEFLWRLSKTVDERTVAVYFSTIVL